MNPHKIILCLSAVGIIVTTTTLIIALYENITFVAFLAAIGNICVFSVGLISLIAMKDEE